MADPRGRTPLHLAVTLQRVKCVQVLLNHGANTLAVNRHHWNGTDPLITWSALFIQLLLMFSVFQEAICTGNSELAGLVLQYRDEQLAAVSRDEIPVMLAKLESTSDFYIEMTWKFSSWGELGGGVGWGWGGEGGEERSGTKDGRKGCCVMSRGQPCTSLSLHDINGVNTAVRT